MAAGGDVRTSHSITVAASPQSVYRCLWDVDLGRSPFIRLLLSARGLSRLRTMRAAVDSGFTILTDDPPRRLVLGLIGKPWRPSGQVQRVAAGEFDAFAEPGFVKVYWEFQISGAAPEVTVTTSTSIRATDGAAQRRFRAYWRFVGPFSGVLRRSMLRSIRSCAQAD